MDTPSLPHVFRNLGFTEGESKVYLTLLETGESKVGPLIKSSTISRSKVYDILERLIKKGIVSKIEKKGIFFYQALPPYTLLSVIKKKKKELKREEELLHNILPTLLKFKPKQKINIVVYEGFAGFKTMINRTLEELRQSDIYEAMGISKTTEAMRHYARKIYDMQTRKKFKARSIFDEKGVYKINERKTPLHEIRVLPPGWETPALFTIYQNTVGIHLGEDETIISVIISNAHIARSFRTTFQAMWNIAKPF